MLYVSDFLDLYRFHRICPEVPKNPFEIQNCPSLVNQVTNVDLMFDRLYIFAYFDVVFMKQRKRQNSKNESLVSNKS